MPLPRFDEIKFPFLMMSGDSSFSLLNVHTGHMEPFINTATSVKLCQAAFFFLDDAEKGMTMHFTTTSEISDDEAR